MFKVFIGVGHGGKDSGAYANGLKESDVNLNMALAMADVLIKNGYEVALSRQKDEDDRLGEEIRECNNFKPDIAVEIHNNAGGGDGFECYMQTNGFKVKSQALAKALEKRVIEFGQNSRGIKTKLNKYGTDYFGWLRECKCPAVLCEGFFLDNLNDKIIADTLQEQQEFGKSYAKGVMDYFGVKEKPPEIAKKLYKVKIILQERQAGAFSSELNAKNYAKHLQEKGYKTIIE